MKIYFCQQCGVSVPLEEVAAGQARSGDGHIYCSHHMPASASGGDLELYFCDSCSGSIALQDVITGSAKTDGGTTLCPRCARAEKKRADGASSAAGAPASVDDDDPFRLYFCDACNTSVPHSHVVSGRAMVRGGKTFCEVCKTSGAGTRRLSPVIPVVALLLVAVGVVVALAVTGAFAGKEEVAPTGPSVDERIASLRADYDGRLSGLDTEIRGIRGSNDQAFQTMARKGEAFERSLEETDASIKNFSDMFRGRIKVLEEQLDKLAELEAQVATIPALKAEIERLRADGIAGGGSDAIVKTPKDDAPSEPEENEPVREVPEEVTKRIALLANADSGVRFTAAVELGKLGDIAAREPLETILLQDEDLFVRRAAARALGELADRAACPKLIESLGDREIYVALQAVKSLRLLTKKNFGFRENLSASQRRSVIAKWEKWWADHGQDEE